MVSALTTVRTCMLCVICNFHRCILRSCSPATLIYTQANAFCGTPPLLPKARPLLSANSPRRSYKARTNGPSVLKMQENTQFGDVVLNKLRDKALLNIESVRERAGAKKHLREHVQKYYASAARVKHCDHGNCHWTHQEATSWGSICNGKYSTCSKGKLQSPIDVTTGNLTVLPNAQMIGWNIPDKSFEEYAHYVKGKGGDSAAVESYNGHTFEVAHIDATFTYNDVDYTLKGFHMHTRSEHTFDGEHTDLEIHFVHTTNNASAVSKVLVVAAFFKAVDGHGSPSFIRQLVEASGNLNDVPKTVVPVDFAEVAQTVMIGSLTHRGSGSNAGFIPNFRNYMSYTGSFTTPPCTEGVQWILLRNPIYIYEDDAKALRELMGDNFRPVLPLNGRIVTTSV